MTDGQRTAGRRATRGLAVLAVAATIGAGLLAVGSQAAMAQTVGRISGGVEDGSFSVHCLSGGDGKADPGVLDAYAYRQPIGTVVRILVPYNIASSSTEVTCLENYLAAVVAENTAQANAVQVEMSLNRAASGVSPTASQYATAVDTLHDDLASKSELGDISYLSAWNEPNNPGYLTHTGWATLAGGFFATTKKEFAGNGITMIAGDFSADAIGASELDNYISAAGGVNNSGIPTGGYWGIHPYQDVRHFESLVTGSESPAAAGETAAADSSVTALASELHTHKYGNGTLIWLDEVAIYDSYDGTSYSATAVDDAADFLTDNAATSTTSLAGYIHANLSADPQVGRYIYLRADDATSSPATDADGQHILQVNFQDCVYWELTNNTTQEAAHSCPSS